MRKTLLLLRTPPPFGGGELQQKELGRHYRARQEYRVIEVSSKKRDKSNQSRFALWKLGEFLRVWALLLWLSVSERPNLFVMSISKGFPHFFRDSLFIWTASLFCIPVALELHGIDFYFLKGGGFRAWYGRFVLSRVRCIRTLGPSIARRLTEHGITNAIVLANGVETGAVSRVSVEARNGQIHLLFVGTLSRDKGFGVLMEASEILAETTSAFQIHCMGQWASTAYEEEARNHISVANMSKHYVFHGVKTGSSKWKVFSNSHVLVLPSFFEGQPLVILEGMSFGIPIVSSCVGAIPDTVKDGRNGFLIPPGDAIALANKLEDLICDANLRDRMGQTNYKEFPSQYSMDWFLRNHEDWLASCRDGSVAVRMCNSKPDLVDKTPEQESLNMESE